MTTTHPLQEQIERVAAMVVPRLEGPATTPPKSPSMSEGEKRALSLEELCRRKIPTRYQEANPAKVSRLSSALFERTGALFIGPPGIGKTYAATALAKLYVASTVKPLNTRDGKVYPDRSLAWITAPRFLARIRSTMSPRARESSLDVLDELCRASVLVLDDYGADKPSDFAAESLYDLLTGRLNDCRYTIVTSNLALEDIAAWRPSIASRLAEFARVDLPGPDRRLFP